MKPAAVCMLAAAVALAVVSVALAGPGDKVGQPPQQSITGTIIGINLKGGLIQIQPISETQQVQAQATLPAKGGKSGDSSVLTILVDETTQIIGDGTTKGKSDPWGKQKGLSPGKKGEDAAASGTASPEKQGATPGTVKVEVKHEAKVEVKGEGKGQQGVPPTGTQDSGPTKQQTDSPLSLLQVGQVVEVILVAIDPATTQGQLGKAKGIWGPVQGTQQGQYGKVPPTQGQIGIQGQTGKFGPGQVQGQVQGQVSVDPAQYGKVPPTQGQIGIQGQTGKFGPGQVQGQVQTTQGQYGKVPPPTQGQYGVQGQTGVQGQYGKFGPGQVQGQTQTTQGQWGKLPGKYMKSLDGAGNAVTMRAVRIQILPSVGQPVPAIAPPAAPAPTGSAR